MRAQQFIPTSDWLHRILAVVCTFKPILCDGVVGPLFGETGPYLNTSRTGVYFAHFPDTTSTKNLMQWIQNCRTGEFADINGRKYDVSTITNPVAVFYGTNDLLATEKDIKYLASLLRNLVLLRQNGFAHMDFTWAPDAASTIYPEILSLLNRY